MISLKSDTWSKDSCISQTKLLGKRAGFTVSSGPRETREAGSRGAGSRPSNAGRSLSAWFFSIENHLPIVLCYVLYNFKSNKNDKKNANKGNTSFKKINLFLRL
jgi:hypothetical protein